MDNVYDLIKPIDFTIVGIYLMVLIGIGYWVSFIKKKNKNENLFLAGHSLKWGSIGFTMWGTNVGPSMLIASASIGYTTGIVAGNFGWYAFVFIFLLAVVFAPRYLGAKVQTLPEFMGKRFGQSTRNILAWYALATILISWLGLTLFAGGIFIRQILDLPMWSSVIILVIIAAFFTIAGGLKAVAYTNVFQMSLLIVVSFILTIVGVLKLGNIYTVSELPSPDYGSYVMEYWNQFQYGLKYLWKETPANYWNLFLPIDNKDYPWLAIVLGYPIMGIWFWCTDQSMVQSVLGAKNLKQGQLGTNFTGWLKILDVAIFIIPGIICYKLYSGIEPDKAYMKMVTGLFPTGAIGLIMALLIAALVSTIDSALNSLSTVFTMDIYIKKFKPEANQKQIIKIGRIVTLIGAIVAIFLAIAIDNVENKKLFDKFQIVLAFISPPMSVAFLFGVLWKKTSTKAVNLVLSAGTIFSIGALITYLWILPSEVYLFWPHYLLISFLIFVILSVVAFCVTIFDRSAAAKDQNTLDYGTLPKPDRKVWVLWITLIIVMIGLYIFFNGHK